MQNSQEFNKRKLLLEAFAGNLNNVMVYREQVRRLQQKQEIEQLSVRWVIDNREVGGPIEVCERDGKKREITVQEFESLPLAIRNRRVRIQDTTGGIRVPDPDEEYEYVNGQYIFQDTVAVQRASV